MIPPRFLSQLSSTARKRNDCLPACLAMWHNGLYPRTPMTVDQVSEVCGLTDTGPGVRIAEVPKFGRMIGMRLVHRAGCSIADLRAATEAGQPVICLVRLNALPYRLTDERFAHYVLVYGVSPVAVRYVDPYRYPSDPHQGRSWAYVELFDHAWTADASVPDFRISRQAIFWE